MKIVSVIIAAYQAAAFMEEAVASVLRQDLPAGYQLQLIVGVDGCEATAMVATEMEDERLTVFTMDRNYGTYITFNTMMQQAEGELIVRFDADDVMLPGYLQKQIEVLEQAPEVYLTWTRNNYIDQEGKVISALSDREEDQLKYWEIRSPSNGQLMMRRSLWDRLGAFKPWPCNSDTDFLIRMRFLGCAEYGLKEVLYLRRIHPDSLTQSESTGYDSEMRKKIVTMMRRERDERTTEEECWVAPVTGNFLEVRPKPIDK